MAKNNTNSHNNSNNIVSFSFEKHEVRGFDYQGEPYFIGNEVAAALGYASPAHAVSQHCKSLKLLKMGELPFLKIPPRGMNIIPERDVYRLVMRSNLPTAEAFEEKVVGEILPAIRKTGGYMVATPEETPEEIMLRALTIAKETVERQKAQLAEAQPKAEALDRIAAADGSLNITEAAKALQVRPKVLFDWLSRNGWIYKRAGAAAWLGYQAHTSNGDLEHKVTTVLCGDGSEKVSEQVRVTPKGLTRLAKLIAA